MSFNIEVEGGSSVRLPTAGKYCDRDIVITATGGSNDLAKQLIARTITTINDDSIETVGAYGLAYCQSLIEAILPNCTYIGDFAFVNAKTLVSVDIPKMKDIRPNVFEACSSLKNINIPEVTLLWSNSIKNCPALEKLDLPKVKTISSQVFVNDSLLATVILRSNTVASLGNVSSFAGTPIANGTGFIYVPAALIDSYKTATNWSVFANQFRTIEDYPEITGG